MSRSSVDCLTIAANDVLVRPIYMAELKDRAELLIQRESVVEWSKAPATFLWPP